MDRRQFLVSSAFAGFVRLLGLLDPAAAGALSRPQQTQALGQWENTITFLDGPGQGSHETAQVFLLPNGLFASVAANDPRQFALAGCGTWQSTGAERFTFDFHELALDSAAQILLLVHVHQHARVSDDGRSFTSEGWGRMYSNAGMLLGVVHTSCLATRVQ